MTKVAGPARIETERMILRAPGRDDADAIFGRYASDPEVTRYMGFTCHASLQATHEFLDRSELYAMTHPENVPSWRVLEKGGFTREGLLRRCFVFPNLDPEPADVYCYSRICSETDA
jgi:RimJ/RimL family protein N-acetyltransferase